MGLLMKQRDYVADGDSVAAVSGGEGLLNEALFRLTAKRGSYPLMPELGSRLYLLKREKPLDRQSLACQYAAEALAELSDLTVVRADVTQTGDRLLVTVELEWQGDLLWVECEV